MTKKQIKKVAQIYAACLVYNAMGTGAQAECMTDDEHEYFCQQIEQISERLAKGLPDQIFQLGFLDQIVHYVKTGEISQKESFNQWDHEVFKNKQ